MLIIYLFWCLEAQTDFTVMTGAQFSVSRHILAPYNWNCKLLLESTFGLEEKQF